ncbi:MAG: N-acetylmuramoyl-L-alanine amidase [Chlamydiia bacterium]|nr:N-acetylmuramoyl-L-alanine amidase [Chlamydiia bacterium]
MNIFNIHTRTQLLIAVFISLVFTGSVDAQVTGLSDYEIFLDPGHSKTENMGLYQYSEAEKVLRVALELKSMFETQTDIKEVHMSRLTDNDYISLSSRTDLANSLNPDFYYSMHSNAGSDTKNDAFSMYGGWRLNGVTVEKGSDEDVSGYYGTEAYGGKAYGDFLADDLAGVMRVVSLGNFADRVFYQGTVNTHAKQYPYLYVNRTTNMASILSEAGYHTNATQQQKNLNAEWKKMEALSAFHSFLKYKGLTVPLIGVATGVIKDIETGKPINGVTVTIEGQSYTTDTYESLFNEHSNDPEELSNGFYWIEGLTPGQVYSVDISADGFGPTTENLTIKSNSAGSTAENLSFLDVTLTSSVAPIVDEVVVDEGTVNNVIPGKDISLTFSRKMDRASVESAISINPSVALTYSWSSDFELLIHTDNLGFETDYTITIDASIAKNSITSQLLDGDNDGVEGGNYLLDITSAPVDGVASVIVNQFPTVDGISSEIRPVIRIAYDEKLLGSSVGNDAISVSETVSGSPVTGTIKHDIVNNQSVIHFFPTTDLVNDLSYTVTVKSGIEDLFGNSTDVFNFNFTVNEDKITELHTISGGFNSSLTNNWWAPTGSGSTIGVVGTGTNIDYSTAMAVQSDGSEGSMKMNYEWDLSKTSWYIREYLKPSESTKYKFGIDNILQMYVFGDGSNNQIRFMIKDGDAKYEGSQWFTIDWIGWKLISWNLSEDDVYAWATGNGVINGTSGFYIDGIHLQHIAGASASGTVYFDELRYVQRSGYGLSNDEYENNIQVSLYPNPTSGTLNVTADTDINKIEIYDVTGQLIIFNEFSDSSVNMSLDHLNNGLYIVRIITDKTVVNSKIQIRK